MNVRIVLAMGNNREIGQNGKLPWDLPDDLRHFREKTTGKPVIMGRETHQSVGRLLPNRLNIVLTRNPEYRVAGARVVHSIAEALNIAQQNTEEEICVIGGGQVCAAALPYATHLSLTFVAATFPEADTFFPPVDWSEWREIQRTHHPADERHPFEFDFVEFERLTGARSLSTT